MSNNSIILSDEQKSFIECALSGKNILVDACIGSGKTTSIQVLCEQFPDEKRILYLTYNRLLKFDAQEKIKKKNVIVTNYHGYAAFLLNQNGIKSGKTDLIQCFLKSELRTGYFDVLILDEYQDIDQEIADFIGRIKKENSDIQIVAVGDMCQKIYDKTLLDISTFIHSFLGKYEKMTFSRCFRLNDEHASMLGRVWEKNIVGVNSNCLVEEMSCSEVIDYLKNQNPSDVLCLGMRTGTMASVLNKLEKECPDKYNKKTTYASIRDNDSDANINLNGASAIFTTYDSSKGLERNICVLFNFDVHYWEMRQAKREVGADIIRNIFCVAASRGKERIIIVKSDIPKLTESDLKEVPINIEYKKLFEVSSMFDFKYKEDIEKCFSLLDVREINVDDISEIRSIRTDGLIDLSPCVGHYQEVVFFEQFDINSEIELALKCANNEKLTQEYHSKYQNGNDKEKVLFLTSIETDQERYRYQVDVDIMDELEEERLIQRLSSRLVANDNTQIPATFSFLSYNGDIKEIAGIADVLKNNVVYELKFVTELHHEHFLQCACYMVMLECEKGILWNTRTNKVMEIQIPDTQSFMDAVVNTITKHKVENCVKVERPKAINLGFDEIRADGQLDFHKPTDEVSNYFAVIDTETTYADRVMSIGITIAQKNDYESVESQYYVIRPTCEDAAMYADALYIVPKEEIIFGERNIVINQLIGILDKYHISELAAYNASFDKNHLPELKYYTWIDIMRIAPYVRYNKKIPDNLEITRTGRLARNYGVEPMIKMMDNNPLFKETHNAVKDSIDELYLMKLLDLSFNVYYDAIISGKRINSSELRRNRVPVEQLRLEIGKNDKGIDLAKKDSVLQVEAFNSTNNQVGKSEEKKTLEAATALGYKEKEEPYQFVNYSNENWYTIADVMLKLGISKGKAQKEIEIIKNSNSKSLVIEKVAFEKYCEDKKIKFRNNTTKLSLFERIYCLLHRINKNDAIRRKNEILITHICVEKFEDLYQLILADRENCQKEICARYKKLFQDQFSNRLNELPIDYINREKNGIKVQTLKKNGIYTILDLDRCNYLSQISGIGSSNLSNISRSLQKIKREETAKCKVVFDIRTKDNDIFTKYLYCCINSENILRRMNCLYKEKYEQTCNDAASLGWKSSDSDIASVRNRIDAELFELSEEIMQDYVLIRNIGFQSAWEYYFKNQEACQFRLMQLLRIQ